MTDEAIRMLAEQIRDGMGLDQVQLKAMFERNGQPRLAGNVIPERNLAEVSSYFCISRERLNLLPGEWVYVLSIQLNFLRDPRDPTKFRCTLEKMLGDLAFIRKVIDIVERKGEDGGEKSFSV